MTCTDPNRFRPRRLLAALLLAGSLGPSLAAETARWAPGRLLVMPRAGLPAAEFAAVLRPHGGTARRLGGSDLHVVHLPAGVSERAVQRLLARHPLLKFAELDHEVPPALVPNDPYLGSAWHLAVTRTGNAWDTTAGAGVTVAILDSGVLATHADLQANLVPGYNSHDGSSDTTDVTGHGTTVAGVAGAVLDNAVGVAGVSGAARVMPIRITDSAGTAYYSTIAEGVIHAADRGVRVVNCSYGNLFRNASVQSAGSYLKGKGGLLVVSAGNNAIDEQAEDTLSMITVSATDASDQRASWSSYGAMVDIAAPGVGIWTTSRNGGYVAGNGTSYASPLVAGVVALMMSANGSLAPAQIESLLFSSALDLGATGRDTVFGHGRVDAEAAVRAAAQATAVDGQAPSVGLLSPAAGSTVSGTVAVDVAASDNVGVVRVDVLVDGQVVASDAVAPYELAWDSRGTPNGNVTVSARAVDAAGNGAATPGVVVTVANPVVDTLPPTVAFTAPAAGSTVPSGVVKVTAQANDDGGAAALTQVLSIDGKQVLTVAGGSLSYRWNTRRLAKGTHTLSVAATDKAGNRTTHTIQVQR